MNLLNKLERKFGRYCISNLMLYIVIGTGIVFAFQFLALDIPLMSFLSFDRGAIMRGQIWRVLSFIFIPESLDPIQMIFWLYLYWFIGSSLEDYWGSFRFNAYYFCGVLFAVIGGFIAGYATVHYLNLTLFLAIAVINPNMQLRLFFFLPVKMKWLAWIDAAFLIYNFIFTPFMSRRIIIFMSVLNFLLFFGGDFFRFIRDKIKYRKIRSSFKNRNR